MYRLALLLRPALLLKYALIAIPMENLTSCYENTACAWHKGIITVTVDTDIRASSMFDAKLMQQVEIGMINNLILREIQKRSVRNTSRVYATKL